MTAINVESRKRAILEYLAETQDEAILMQIENLIKPSVDIWDELSEAQKVAINKGIEALRQGKKIGYEEFIMKYRSEHAV